MLNLAVKKRFTVAKGKRVAVGEYADISGNDPQRINRIGDRRRRRGDGDSLLMEGICDRCSTNRGLDGRRQLGAASRHCLTVGQGDGCRARRWRFGLLAGRFLSLSVFVTIGFV